MTDKANQIAHSFQEFLKGEGWQDVKADTGKPIDERALGLLKVITSHFLRSVRRERRPGYAWGDYVQHWLVANGDDRDEQDVIKYLREAFGRPRGEPMLSHGRTYWGT